VLQWLEDAFTALATNLNLLLGLGRDIEDVTATQMGLRTVAIYVAALGVIRLGSKRFLSQPSAFDVVVSIMLGSIMSRAINGSAPLLPTIASGAALIGLHWLFGFLAVRTGFFGDFIKGEPRVLIEDGVVQDKEMRRAQLTPNDLEQALRLQSKQTDPAKIRRAYLERNGSISVEPYPAEPRVLEVRAEPGVQTVRIELGP
jgi:uncharacterized membrane protein YcaP (DUF421 family)